MSVDAGRIRVGSRIDDVVAQLRQPIREIDLGAKKTYIYPDKKIVMTSGQVSAIQ